MLLVHNLDFFAVKRQLEQGDRVVRHELGRNRPACQSREFLSATGDILTSLSHAELVGAALRLNGDRELLPVAVDPDVDLVNLDLANTDHHSSQMVLEGIRRNTEE